MEWIRQVLAVSGVLLLLGAALWWLRRKGLAQYGTRSSTGARKRTLESVERLALGPQHSLHLVRLAGRGLLVGASGIRTRLGGPMMSRRFAFLCGLALLLPLAASAAGSATASSLLGTAKAGTLSMPMQTVLMLTALTLLPAALVSVTPFLRTIIVLHFLRQALGTQTAPSNQVLMGGQITVEQAAQEASQPLRQFWSRFAKEKDIALFLEVSHSPAPRTPADVDLKVLIPAYILSELKAAFQIGAVRSSTGLSSSASASRAGTSSRGRPPPSTEAPAIRIGVAASAITPSASAAGRR